LINTPPSPRAVGSVNFTARAYRFARSRIAPSGATSTLSDPRTPTLVLSTLRAHSSDRRASEAKLQSPFLRGCTSQRGRPQTPAQPRCLLTRTYHCLWHGARVPLNPVRGRRNR
jgi:hypothetical protein